MSQWSQNEEDEEDFLSFVPVPRARITLLRPSKNQPEEQQQQQQQQQQRQPTHQQRQLSLGVDRRKIFPRANILWNVISAEQIARLHGVVLPFDDEENNKYFLMEKKVRKF